MTLESAHTMTSWFSELTSRAEAILVKLDQDAAQALQGSDGLLVNTKLPDNSATDNEESPVHNLADVHVNSYDIDDDSVAVLQRQSELSRPSVNTSDNEPSSGSVRSPQPIFQSAVKTELSRPSKTVDATSNHDYLSSIASHQNDAPQISTRAEEPLHSRKFRIQSSANGNSIFRLSNHKGANGFDAGKLADEMRNFRDATKPIEHFEADNIRASINKSLQDYASERKPRTITPQLDLEQTHQHFDNQPIVVKHPSKNHQVNSSSSPLKSSSSFSIQLPEDVPTSDATDMAARLLKQHSASRKKSPLNIHKVLNSLTSFDRQSDAIISDQTRVKLRRLQLRAASYARRLNYYFRVYPNLKYVVLCYILFMQLLIVYVLFFYQSTGSATELSSQIRQQQQELARSGLYGANENQVSGHEEKLIAQLV